MSKLPKSFKLVLAGPPLTDRDLVPGLKADQIPTLKKRAQELGVGKRVIISHGFVDMAKYLAAMSYTGIKLLLSTIKIIIKYLKI